MKVVTSPARLAGLASMLVAAIAVLVLLTPGMARVGTAFTGTSLGCLVLLVNARLRLIRLA